MQVLQYFWDAVWCWLRCSSGSAVRGAGVLALAHVSLSGVYVFVFVFVTEPFERIPRSAV